MTRALAGLSLVLVLLACKKREKPADWDEHPVEPGHFLTEIDGSSERDVWVLGNSNLHHFDGRWTSYPLAMRKLSVAGPNDAWFGGYMGTVVHWDGAKHHHHPIEAAKKRYSDVATIAAWPGEVWVGFNEPGYFRRAGDRPWELVEPAELSGFRVMSLWGKTKDDVWAGLMGKTVAKVAHLSNGRWTIFDRPPGLGFAGTRVDDVWFMGAGAMVHWNGAGLTDHPLPDPKALLYDVAASTANDALVVGKKGVAMRWDGTRWGSLANVGGRDLNRAFAAPGGRYFVISGGSVLVHSTP